MKVPALFTISPILRVCLLAAGLAMPSHAAVLAAWHTWADNTTPYTANTFASGFTATVATATNRINTSFGSTDGKFGNALVGASTSLGGLLLRQSSGDLTATITITNTSGSAYSIDSLHFDFGVRIQSADSFTLTYVSGGLGTPGTIIGSETQLAETIGATQATGEGNTYYNFDYNLASKLSDIVLANNESATFTFVASGQGTQANYSTTGSSILDNIAIQGTAVPEPSVVALMGVLGAVGLLRRRRAA